MSIKTIVAAITLEKGDEPVADAQSNSPQSTTLDLSWFTRLRVSDFSKAVVSRRASMLLAWCGFRIWVMKR
ncbi:MAG: hypothetical protein GX970_12580 [Phyllobacteriaceae bacterium]|nr:hypothetical protein [Phyllobacteriaceae bacterium]